MNYYDENDNRPMLYGGVAAAAYIVVVAALMLLVYIPIVVMETPQIMRKLSSSRCLLRLGMGQPCGHAHPYRAKL